jgi:hypothetical protein
VVAVPVVHRELAQALAPELARAAAADPRQGLERLLAVGPRALLQVIGAMQALVAALEGLASSVEELAELAWWHMQCGGRSPPPLAQAVLPESAWREMAAAFAARESPIGKGPAPA